MRLSVPKEVFDIYNRLIENNHKAYLVGGCSRDLIIGREPKDWDITTDARPPELQLLFPESVYENQFGTVGVKTKSDDERLKIVEITTFRLEGKYSDKRHPDDIKFADTVEEDLARRDFTINAIAFEATNDQRLTTDDPIFVEGEIIDPFHGGEDIESKIIRTVGEPGKRFNEDALRMMRAVRFSCELDFEIEEKTEKGIKANNHLLGVIAKERIRDELTKIIMSPKAKYGLEKLEELGLLKYILPEFREGIGVGQNKHHKYTVWEHGILSLDYAAEEKYSLEVRLAALTHDIGKPRVKTGEGPDSHFFSHEVVGEEMASKMLDRLHFSRETIAKVAMLVRFHMFKADPDEITEAAVRRTIRSVGSENIWELINLRTADRIGSGVPKAQPFRLRAYMALVEKNLREPVSLKQMVLKGDHLMELLKIPAGPKVGWILYILFEEVLDAPEKNNLDYLEKRAGELGGLSDVELGKMAEKAKSAYTQILSEEEEEIKKKYYVD